MPGPTDRRLQIFVFSVFFASALIVSGCGAETAKAGEAAREESEGKAPEATANSGSVAEVVVDAEFGRWKSQAPPSLSSDTVEFQNPSLAAMTTTPVVHSVEDLQRHLLGDALPPLTPRKEIRTLAYLAFQQIPGVPLGPRYRDTRYDVVRGGFTQQCTDSVDTYQQLIVNAFMSSAMQVHDVLRDARLRSSATTYESECLTALKNVPVDIRRVLGVLTVGPSPFCSATIIGKQKVLTSRHCFVDPSTGKALKYLHHWKDGNVSFVPAVPQNSVSSFKLKEPAEDVLSRIVGKFKTLDDYWVVDTSRALEFAASYERAPADMSRYPITAWLVGSNINLDDIGQERTPLEFIRAAAPTACAVLEKTADGCLYHTCQSSKSTSGAGILVANGEGAVRIFGVHKGTIAEATGCEATPPSGLRLNFGITDLSL